MRFKRYDDDRRARSGLNALKHMRKSRKNIRARKIVQNYVSVGSISLRGMAGAEGVGVRRSYRGNLFFVCSRSLRFLSILLRTFDTPSTAARKSSIVSSSRSSGSTSFMA